MTRILKLLFLIALISMPGYCLLAQSLSSSDRFTTIYPKQNQTIFGEVIFSWNGTSLATSYEFQLSTELSFNSLLINELNLTTSNFKTNIAASNNYYWRVIAKDGSSNIDTTGIATFSVFSPKSLDSLSLWLIGDSVNLSTLNRVSSWFDLSDPTNLLTQGNAARQPDFIPNYINGYGVVDFPDIRPSVFTSICNVPGKNYYVSSVYNWHGSVGLPTRFINSQTAGNGWNLGPNNNHSLSQQTGLVGAGLPIEQDRFVLNTAYAAGDSVSNIINGNLIAKALTSRAPEVLRISIGNTQKMNGAVAEIIVYAGLVSKIDQEKIDNYLMDKYAPPINLGPDRILCSLPDSINLVNDYIVNYSWNTGDTTSNVRFDTSGLYILSATDIFGRIFSDSILIIQDTVDFTVDFNTDTIVSCQGQLYALTSNLTSSRYSYLWSTGDTTPTINVSQTGNYKLRVQNCIGNFSSDSVQVIFNRPIFSLGNDTIGCHNNFVQLTPDSNFTNVNYSWSSGENSASVFADTAGVYRLTVSDAYGCSFSDSIFISIDSTLLGLTLGSDTTLCGGNSIEILNPVSGISSYQWSTGNTLASQQVDTSGSYAVVIGNGQCLVSDTLYVNIKGLAPNVGFSTGKLCQNELVQFTDTTSDPNNISISSYRWDFGDGDSSLLKNPSHQFDSALMYTVSLEVLNDSGCVGSFSTLLQINSEPTNNFDIGISCENDSTQFINSSTLNLGTITRYFWDFGVQALLGDTSNLINPSYTYNQDSLFLVSLISESSEACMDTITKSIKVNSKPAAAFTFSSVVFGNDVQFVNTSNIGSGLIVSNQWDFGNGNTSPQINPTQSYSALGKYFVSLTVSSDSSCSDSFTDSVIIIPPSPQFNTIHPKTDQSINKLVKFDWNERDTTSFYRIQIANDASFSSLLYDSSNLISNTISFNFDLISDYYWRVFAYRNSVIIDTTNVDRFRSFNPLRLDSLTLWLNGDSVLTGANNQVVSWFDRSDSSRVLTQNNSTNQPMLIENHLNGYPVLDFGIVTGADFFLNAVDINNRRYNISSVYNFHESVGRFCSFINSSLAGNRWILGPYFKHRLFQGSNFIGNGLDIVQDRFVVNTAFAEGDSISNIINGVSVGKEFSGNLPRDLRIGINNNERMNGSVAEIIMIEGTVSQSIQSKVDQYLMDKYAPPVNLGSDIVVCSFPDSLSFYKEYIIEYHWNTGDSVSNIEIDSAGLYILEATDIFGRKSIDSLFFIKDTLDFKFNFSQDTINACLGQVVELNTNNEHYKYLWNTGDTLPKIDVNSTAKYKIATENCLGNTYEDSIVVIFNSPDFSLGNDTSTCFNIPINLIPDSLLTNVSYTWSTGENQRSISTLNQGEYSLTVEDQFNCSFIDTITISIDSSLYNLTLGPDTNLCKGNRLGIINPIAGINTYQWSNGLNTSTIVLDSSSNYKLTVTKDGCQVSDSASITIIGDVPFVDFLTANYCLNDTVSFLDLSIPPSGDTIKEWLWDFGDGNTSAISQPVHQFASVSTYDVILKVTTDKGCSDTTKQSINVYPLPIADFTIINNCSKEAITFNDNSTVPSGVVLGYTWNFGDLGSANNLSNAQNPIHIYDTLGSYTITLVTETDRGCRDTVAYSKIVNPIPIVDFGYTGTCLGDTTKFYNQTILPSGSVDNYLWGINWLPNPSGNVTSLDSNTQVFIPLAKDVKASLRVITDSGCIATFRDTFFINPKPVAGFTINDNCINNDFIVTNTSSILTDSIVYQRFIFRNKDTSFSENPSFLGDSVGFFPISLLVQSSNGCLDSIRQSIEISPLPIPNFRILNNNTGIPFDIDLQNNSTSSKNYIWSFGNGDTLHGEKPNYTYRDTGTFSIELTAISAKGCVDSISKLVNVLPFYLDAALGDIYLSEGSNGFLKVEVQLLNTGNNTINQIELVADLNSEFQFQEVSTETLYSGTIGVFQFNSSFIQDQGSKVDFVCVRIASVNGIEDEDLTNNYLCEKGFNENLFVNIFPNPTFEKLNMEYVLPRKGNLRINIYDQMGKRVVQEVNGLALSGIYKVQFNTADLRPGIYHYELIFEGTSRSGSFIKL